MASKLETSTILPVRLCRPAPIQQRPPFPIYGTFVLVGSVTDPMSLVGVLVLVGAISSKQPKAPSLQIGPE